MITIDGGEPLPSRAKTTVALQYGSTGLDVELPSENLTIIEPSFTDGLANETAAFITSVRNPLGSKPLREIIGSEDKVAIVIPDITRPMPSDRILPMVLEELGHVPDDNFTIINGTGSHRANSDDELLSMVGSEIISRIKIVNHNAHDPETLLPAGNDARSGQVFLNKEYINADRRIVLGFIEPHFMAGFSGGYKAVFPGIADIDSIMRYHDAITIAHPRSTWGVLEGNPTQETVRYNGALIPIDFCINCTLNKNHEITKFFCGEVHEAHNQGCAYSKQKSMVCCEQEFDIVITTNSGYPLDQNLYQTVKGISAAAMITKDNGFIACASECRDGFPSHGNFLKLMHAKSSPQELLEMINQDGFSMYDQWEAQLLAQIQIKAKVGLYSTMDAQELRKAFIEPLPDLTAAIAQKLNALGSDATIAVLPQGPQTIPYVGSVDTG